MGEPIALVLLVARQLVALVVLAGAAAGVGHACTRRLRTTSGTEALAVALASGLGVLGSVLFVAGLAGALHRGGVLALAVAGWALGAWTVRPWTVRAWRSRAGRRSAPAGPAPPADRRLLAAARVAVVAAALLPTFVWSLFPPTGFDATTYHLPFARAFAEAHRLVVVPELLFPVFPQLAETLFAGMLLATGTDLATHLVQLLAMAATALLLHAGGRRFFSPGAGLWAPALWLAHPLVHYQAASAYVDLVLALFCLLAVHAWEAWWESPTGDGAGLAAGTGRGWLALAGAATGFAAASKYLGLLWLGLLAAFTVAAGPRRRRLSGGAGLLLMALVVAGPWYARIHHHTGNPVHPVLEPLFTGGAPSRLDAALGLDEDSSPFALPAAVAREVGEAIARPGELVAFAWRASFDRRAFDRQSPLAPWNLALVPLAMVFALRDRRLLRWLLLVAAYALLWTTRDPRFQLPSVALLALAGAGAIHHLGASLPAVGRRLARPAVAWALAVALALPGPLYAVYKVVRHGPLPPASAGAREAFLDRELAGHSAVRRLDELHGDGYTVFTVHGEYLTYFADGRLLGHVLGPYRVSRIAPLLADAEALHRELRAMDVDHLLVVHSRSRVPLLRGPDFDRRFRRLAGDGRAELFALIDPG
ncbi:MAG TPA: glycosyltransferase family 39 protein [Thermoanaerobaculia bacterium]|nr:glycosyltransferase family 39 protein [Thermoanaerobaculia bacterium]